MHREWEERDSTLVVLPTGGGKTILFATVIGERAHLGRTIVLAHREELIQQAATKIKAVTGMQPEIEMASQWADRHSMYERANVVVSSIQTQVAGQGGKGRMTRFDPLQFSTLIVDECHHATADTYRRVIAHYRQNPNLKVLGVTATPDRADEAALGQIFESVAYSYEISDAIRDGWLVPIRQRMVEVEALDLSNVRTTAGDLNGGQLGDILENEPILLAMATPTLEISCGLEKGTIAAMVEHKNIDNLPTLVKRRRKSVIFAATVKQAERFAEILNRFLPGCASWVCGETDDDQRRQIFRDFSAGKTQYLVNVGICTEGWDEPTVEMVVVARPTKSRSLYTQMCGRGTRILPGIVETLATPAERSAAIAASAKPSVEIIDFAGNAGRHKLVTTADILGGKMSADVVERAREKAKRGESVDMLDELGQAKRAIDTEREQSEKRKRDQEAREAKRRAEEEERRRVRVAQRNYHVEEIDPLNPWDVRSERHHAPSQVGEPASSKQLYLLRRLGVDGSSFTKRQASAVISKKLEEQKSRTPAHAAGRSTFDQLEAY